VEARNASPEASGVGEKDLGDLSALAYNSPLRVVMPRRQPLLAGHQQRRNVMRVDHHDFHGWYVCLKRAGQRYGRYFRDAGGSQAALAKAIRWRNALTARLPPPRKFKRRYSRNTTGVIGVSLSRERTRKGVPAPRYCATWIDEGGRQRKRSFSIGRFGREKALSLASNARHEALEQLLRPARST
jgi:hypothetical protein